MDQVLRLETAHGRDDQNHAAREPVEKPRVPPTQEERDRVSRIVAGIPGTARHRSSKDAKAIASFRRFGNEEPEKLDNPTATTVAEVAEVAERVADENAIRDRKARKDPELAYTLEQSRRLAMAVDAGGKNYARFLVPMDHPLADDLRRQYGHPCPGYDPPKPPSAAEMHDAAQSRNIRSEVAVGEVVS